MSGSGSEGGVGAVTVPASVDPVTGGPDTAEPSAMRPGDRQRRTGRAIRTSLCGKDSELQRAFSRIFSERHNPRSFRRHLFRF
ncbi:protein of unknown function [Azospirillum lipoferum 4B]|uniref:Uncharacterized protein n=1 Tax=Azospirillum lipoferum (strain 4B) TaxID=862719 RepID=G7Z2K1_AZOL4|nr:protein of unknown function [Azospirillum lipoferum 4B]